jgi:hypothetical protein
MAEQEPYLTKVCLYELLLVHSLQMFEIAKLILWLYDNHENVIKHFPPDFINS